MKEVMKISLLGYAWSSLVRSLWDCGAVRVAIYGGVGRVLVRGTLALGRHERGIEEWLEFTVSKRGGNTV
jgi:hypothetical protein